MGFFDAIFSFYYINPHYTRTLHKILNINSDIEKRAKAIYYRIFRNYKTNQKNKY